MDSPADELERHGIVQLDTNASEMSISKCDKSDHERNIVRP